MAVTYLLDVNVLVALLWEPHVRHASAMQWFRTHSESWATSPVTEMGFVRVATLSPVSRTHLTPARAIETLEAFSKHPNHVFWPADLPFPAAIDAACHPMTGGNQTTDAYLLSLAVHKGGKLATFDRGIVSLVKGRDAVEVIELIADPGAGVQ